MVEWSKTWDLSLHELPHHASGAGSNPAPVIVLFPPTHAHGVPKKYCATYANISKADARKGVRQANTE